MAEDIGPNIDNLFKNNRDASKKYDDEIYFTDASWVSDRFMVNSLDLDEPYNTNRFNTLVNKKINDTSLGGSIAINCFPQFTRYADPRSKGALLNRNDVRVNDLGGNIGMGRYYGEAIDDNATDVYFEFGVREFNNILYYLISAVDYKKAVIANTGRNPLFYDAGYVFGLGALFLAFPLITVGLLVAKTVFNVATNVLASPGKFDHYYLKPTMFLYWSTVNSLVTMMSTELGILSPIFLDDKADPNKVGQPMTIHNDDLDAIREIMPGLITTGNAINVQAMVCKTQMLHSKMVEQKLKAATTLETAHLDKNGTLPLEKLTNDVPNDLWKKLKGKVDKDENYKSKKKTNDLGKLIDELKTDASVSLDKLFGSSDDGTYDRKAREQDSDSWLSKAWETQKAVVNEGARFAVFRVDHLPSTSESFSNSTTETSIGSTVNSLGSKWREMEFNLGGGEIPGVKAAADALLSFAVGALDGVTLGVSNAVAGFLSGATIETNKRWDKSNASFPSLNFSMDLVSPSAHPLAQLRNIYIPLASILAGVLPLATGPKSHTSPFLCNMFVRGRQRISLGMITNVNITRGTSNLPFNKQKRPLAVKVTFTVTDFSEVVSAPIVDDLLSSGNVMFDDESGISRYIQSLCGRDLYSTVHVLDKAKIKISRGLQEASVMMTPEYWGSKIGDMTTNSGIFSILGDKSAVNYSELY